MLIELTIHGGRKVIIRADKIIAIAEVHGTMPTIIDAGPESAYTVAEPFREVEHMWRLALKERGVHVEPMRVGEERARNLGPARTPYQIPENGA